MVRLERLGAIFIKKGISKHRLCLGGVLVAIGLIPNGLGIIAYPLAFMVLGITRVDMIYYKDRTIRKIKSKCLQWSLYNG